MFKKLLSLITSFIMFFAIVSPSLVRAADSSPSIKIQMSNVNRTITIQQLNPQFKVINNGKSSIDLKDIKFRYYFTIDGDKPLNFDYWSSIDKSHINSTFIKMSNPLPSADYYLEIGFKSSAGKLAPGKNITIISWFNKLDWSNFTQTNDYSFDKVSKNFVDNKNVPAYIGDTLKWGIEPSNQQTLPYPLNLRGTSSQTSVELSWDTVANASSYDLLINGIVIPNITSTSYSHKDLIPNTQYNYKVRAKNSTLMSNWSPEYSIKTGESIILPVPQNLKTISKESSINISWSPVPNATLYDLEVDGVIISDIVNTSYIHSGLIPDTPHTYRVRAKNNSKVSNFSNPVNTRTLPQPTTTKTKVKLGTNVSPATSQPSPNFEVYNTSNSPINLKDIKLRYYFTIDSEKVLNIDFWTTLAKTNVITRFYKMPIPGENADHYLEISFSENAGTLLPGSKVGVYTWFNKLDWSSFNQANDYSYNASTPLIDCNKVTSHISGMLDWGIQPKLYNIPAFPRNIICTPLDNSITITWDKIEGATGYDINADGTIIENLKETKYTDNYLSPGTLHTYKVRTRKDNSLSIWSDAISVRTTGEQSIPVPENIKATPSTTSISVSWDALSDTISGYDIEVDGKIIDNKTNTTYTHTGLIQGSQHTYRVRAKNNGVFSPWSTLIKINTIYTPTGNFNVSFNINTSLERAPISPYIYGTNDDLTGTENFTSRRIGGNRLSTYNWENNASNAGADWMHSSDGFVPWYYGGVDSSKYSIPGIGVSAFHEKSLTNNAYSLVTLQTAGYVAKDMKGSVSKSETAPSNRWVSVKPSKNAPFSLTPDLNDENVYMDEFVNYLVNKFGNASSPRGIKGYAIDNEPGLWAETHPYMHPGATGSAEVLNKSVELAKAVKKVDPYAEIFGPVLYGFSDYFNMQSSPDWNNVKGNYQWYIDYYLDKMRIESTKENKRLLDVLDLHWYPEITAGGSRITSSDTNNNLECNKARIQAPRSLWDPSFKETSWIGQWYGHFLPLIPKLQSSINTYNPGTKLAFTEYNYGGENHISGGIATADVLGIFGKYNVYLANYWKMVDSTSKASYSSAAFKIYNNYDGKYSKYGDTKVKAETSDIVNSSIYSSVFKDSDNNLHIIAINKNYDHPMNATFNISSAINYTSGRVWGFDSQSSNIVEKAAITSINNNTFTYTIPKLSVLHLVLKAS